MQPLSQVYPTHLRASGEGTLEIASALRDDITSFYLFEQGRIRVSVTLSIIISLLALLATFYQLHLQRVHNEKSLKPLAQIDLPDHNKQIAVHIRNNGLGPLIIDRLTFIKSDNIYSSIKDCLDLDPKSYMHVSVNDSVKRVVLPNSYLEVFGAVLEEGEDEANLDRVRLELTPITLKAECRDIYDNKIVIERDFKWFSRYMAEMPLKLRP